MAANELPVLGDADAADGARGGVAGPTSNGGPPATDPGERLGRGPIGTVVGPDAHGPATGAELLARAAREAGVSPEPTIPDDAPADVRPLWAALGEVRDPELPVSLVDLGLIYGIRREGGRVEVEMTFTAMGCPCMMVMEMDVRDRLLAEDGVDEVAIEVVWDPPWSRRRMTEKARKILRKYGVAA